MLLDVGLFFLFFLHVCTVEQQSREATFVPSFYMHVRQERCCLLQPGGVCFADPTGPFDSSSSSPSRPSSTADISPCNLRKALPVGYEEKERWIVLCSVLKGSQIVDSLLGEQDSHPELRVRRPWKGFSYALQQQEKCFLIPPEMAGLIVLYTRCVQCECLNVCVWVCMSVKVCVSALTDTSHAICHGAGSTSAGCQGTSRFLTRYMIHEQLSIMNAATPLILLAEELLLFQILSLNNMRKNCIFARMKGESVFPWDVRNIIKYVIPISGLAAPLSTIVDLSAACRECFLRPKRADAASVMICLEPCRFVCMSPIEFSEAIPRGVAAVIWRGTDIWVPTDHLTACTRQ